MTILRCSIVMAMTLGVLAGAGAQPAAVSPATTLKPAMAVAKAADKPIWSQLSPAQQLALEPLHAEWDPMESVRKKKWLELANHYASMTPEEQQRVHERMREWVRLTPAQRKVARQNFTQARTIAPNEKTATWESYKQLPDEQKQKLAEQAKRKAPNGKPPGVAASAASSTPLK
jgi:hypothetical protein